MQTLSLDAHFKGLAEFQKITWRSNCVKLMSIHNFNYHSTIVSLFILLYLLSIRDFSSLFSYKIHMG